MDDQGYGVWQPIPDEALNSHVGVLGKTGSGKTYTSKGLVERLLSARRQVVVIDPTGAWYGLRTGFDVPIFGGRNGDIEISDKAGEAVSSVIVEQSTSAIVDLSLMSGGAQRRFMTAFAHRLRQKPPGALWLVLDEADEFLPQQLQPDMTNLFGDLKWMVRRGRLNGFRVLMITQRPAEIAKAVLTQIETLVAHRLTAPQDRKAIEEWVKGHHDPAEAKEVLSSLASLERGVAWVWAPDLDILAKEKMPEISTFDSSRTPEPGEAAVAAPPLASLDLSAIRAAMAPSADEPKAKDCRDKFKSDDALHEAEVKIGYLETDVERLTAEVTKWREKAERQDEGIKRAVRALGYVSMDELDQREQEAELQPAKAQVVEAKALPRSAPAPRPPKPSPSSAADHISVPQQRILDAVAWWQAFGINHPRSEQVAFVAGYSPSSSGYANLKGAMRSAGLIDYPAPGHVALTEAGQAKAAAPSVRPSRAAFHAGVRAKLSAPQQRLLNPLIAAYPDDMTSEDLAAAAGYSSSSSGFANLKGSMRSLGFMDYPAPGRVRAEAWLFP